MTLELAVNPGPANNPSFDWARWRNPRIERDTIKNVDIELMGSPKWKLGLAGTESCAIVQDGTTQRFKIAAPATVCLLRNVPPQAKLPVELDRSPDETFVILDPGQVVQKSRYAGVQPGVNVVGGVSHAGLLEHPPNHGRTVAIYLMTLPDQATRFQSFIGLRDGSKSEGVEFSVEVNGKELARRPMTPEPWQSLSVDLSPWAGQPIALALVTDSMGTFNFDWAVWGEPRIAVKPRD